ncbi:eukaryotic translation initiation factor 3 subunit F-like [Frieseomelitta varia]|uniref:eukaryotic translation initiation factor 3 subunit F-like n=1 Tax=Frieseomelitta varia TaxID=561572 RepID=UPI001CB68F47|nr:eukaryotic translation initiation factor 3 subunit F-like [Frieseomelitta varia]
MLKFIVLIVAIATVHTAPTSPSAPRAEISEGSASLPTPAPTPAPALDSSSSSLPPARSAASAKALTTITEIKTPASTTKLAHWLAAAPVLSPLQVSPYAYALPALELAAAPSTYSIEQHGYRIIY